MSREKEPEKEEIPSEVFKNEIFEKGFSHEKKIHESIEKIKMKRTDSGPTAIGPDSSQTKPSAESAPTEPATELEPPQYIRSGTPVAIPKGTLFERFTPLEPEQEAAFRRKKPERPAAPEKEVVDKITSELERLLEQGAVKNYVAQGLAGVGTPEAMALRERLLEQGADKNDVARGLAGVNTPEGFNFRNMFFGDNPSIEASSFHTGWSVIDGVICRYGYEA